MHNWATPLFEAPDEIWHYAYVRWLAQGEGLPSPEEQQESGVNQQIAQPPLYYGVAALLTAPFDNTRPDVFWGNPNFGYQAPGTLPDNKNMLIHTEQERFPWQGAILTVHIARLASLLFGLLTVFATWQLGTIAFQSTRLALVTAALVAFHPQFIFISSVVSNDSAAAALATLTLWLTAMILDRGITSKRTALLGLAAGLAALSKNSTLLFIALAGAALLWKAIQRQEQKYGLRVLLLFGVITLVVGGWWYARNVRLYGDPLGLDAHINTPWQRTEASLRDVLGDLPLLIRSFWGAYGWGHVFWPSWIYNLLLVANLALLVHGLTIVFSKNAPVNRAVYLLCGVGFLGILAALGRWMLQVEAPHGRLLFPALGAWAVVSTATWASPGWDRREAHIAQQSFLGLLLSLALLAPGARILATFAPPRLHVIPENEETSCLLQYEGKACLRELDVTPSRAQPGDALHVRACWSALKPIPKNYSVFVHLLGPDNLQVAARHTYPGLGRYPTSLWKPGEYFCETYRMPIAPWAQAPIRYQLEIGLFDLETEERLTARNADRVEVEPPVMAAVTVAPERPVRVPVDQTVEAQLGEEIRLIGVDPSTPTLKAGTPLTLTLFWEAEAEVKEQFVAFVHLWEPGQSQPWAQSDAIPRAGWYPTSSWQAGDVVPDVHTLTIPTDLPSGHYPLWAGMYRPEDGSRLPARGSQGPYPHNLIPVGTLEVR